MGEYLTQLPATLQAIREFIRDVGTPTCIIIFVALVYTGVLKSPLTTIQQDAHDTKAVVTQLASDDSAQHKQQVTQAWLSLGVMRRICRNQPGITDAQRDLCDDPQQAVPENQRWGGAPNDTMANGNPAH